MKQTDQHWEKYGQADPYFGVLSQPKFKKEALDAGKLDEFFRTGDEYVSQTFGKIESHLVPAFTPAKALDFGCGVGRLALPMARRCKQVHGIDVSPSMLAEARRNAEKYGVENIQFFQSDDALSAIGNDYDFINSYYVLQHIPTPRGLRIIEQLMGRLASKGVFVLEVPYDTDRTRVRGAVSKARRYFPPVHYLANLVEGNPLTYPHMEMNIYPLQGLFRIFHALGMNDVCVELGRDPLYHTATLIGQKP